MNHTNRIRVQFLVSQNNAIVSQTQFADAKAAALLALMGVLALRGPVPVERIGPGDPLALAVVAANALSVLFCIRAVMPRYPSPAGRSAMRLRDRFSWPSLAAPEASDEEFGRFMVSSEISALISSLAASNTAMSGILLRKFRMLRIAFALAIADLALILLWIAAIGP